MQTETQTAAATVATSGTVIAAQPVPSIETVAAITATETEARRALAAKLAAKRAENVAAGKPANASTVPAAKPAKRGKRKPATSAAKATPAKPTKAARDAQRAATASESALARSVAAQAVAAFYSGSSKPFKAASDTFAPINRDNAKPGPSGLGTQRQAALLLALATYGAGNIKPDGSFVRGGFNVPARLFNPSAPASLTVRAQPESGALGNALGLTVAFVSGPTFGPTQRDAVYRIDRAAAFRLIVATFGDKHANAFAKLTGYAPPSAKPSRKRA